MSLKRFLSSMTILLSLSIVFLACSGADSLLGINNKFLPKLGRIPNPNIVVRNSSNTVPFGSVIIIDTSDEIENMTYFWTFTGDGSADISDDFITYYAPNETGSATISCRAEHPDWIESGISKVDILVDQGLSTPTVSITSGATVAFSGDVITLQASSPDAGVTYNWQLNGPGTLIPSADTATYTAGDGWNEAHIVCYTTKVDKANSVDGSTDITLARYPYAWLQGNLTSTDSSDINKSSPTTLAWNSSTFDSEFFSHSTSTDSDELVVNADGDYLVSVTVPMSSTVQRPNVHLDILVNGSKVNTATARSGYIRSGSAHTESSNHLNVLLKGLSTSDVISATVSRSAESGLVSVTQKFSMYVEYVYPDRDYFSATANSNTSGTDLNLNSPAALQWSAQTTASSPFNHSDSINSQEITLDQSGDYIVFLNIPLFGVGGGDRAAVKAIISINGTTVNGGECKQGYIRDYSGHDTASLHWSGMITGIVPGDKLTIETMKTVASGAVTTGSDLASLYIEKVNTERFFYSGRGTDLSNGTDWNATGPGYVEWETDEIIDTDTFTHSTTINPHEVTIATDGDYLLIYNDSLASADTSIRKNPKVTIYKNGSTISGAQTKCHYMRVDASTGNNQSSGTLVFLLPNLVNTDTISVGVTREAESGVVNDDQDALLTLWRKQ
jgi:hypothetical protein